MTDLKRNLVAWYDGELNQVYPEPVDHTDELLSKLKEAAKQIEARIAAIEKAQRVTRSTLDMEFTI